MNKEISTTQTTTCCIVGGGPGGAKPFRVPFFARWKLFQRLPARLIAFGLRRVHVED